MIKLMYITNNPEIAKIAETTGVDWIFVDMEFIGKDSRQGGMNTVQNRHSVTDVGNIKNALTKSKLLVRINPIHEELHVQTSKYAIDYPSSQNEIDSVIRAGADIIMLPFFKTLNEVKSFIDMVETSRNKYQRNVKTCLLLETPEAANILEQIVETPGVDMIHIGLNDMHLALGKKFMFQLLTDGSVEKWTKIIKSKGIQYGFGGLASLDGGLVPGKMILKEHYRLGSQQVILSRAFCNTDLITDLDEVAFVFNRGISEIRMYEETLDKAELNTFDENRLAIKMAVDKVVKNK